MLKKVQHALLRNKANNSSARKQSNSNQKDKINSDMKEYLDKKEEFPNECPK
jgi:hypothetical protein